MWKWLSVGSLTLFFDLFNKIFLTVRCLFSAIDICLTHRFMHFL